MAGKKGASGKGNGKVKLSPKVQEETRAKIDTTTIVNKLMGHVKGSNKMESTQIRAAEILLKKTLPDLQAIEHTGEDGGDIKISVTKTVRSARDTD